MVFGRASGDEVHSQLREGAAIHFGKLHLQQYLLRADRAEGRYIDDFWRIGASEFSRTFGDIFGGDMAGQNDRGARRSDRDLLIRKNRRSSSAQALTSTSTRRSKLRERSSSSQMRSETSPGVLPWTRICVGRNYRGESDRRIGDGDMRFRRSVVLISRDLPTITRSGAEPCDCEIGKCRRLGASWNRGGGWSLRSRGWIAAA